jgi:hypothetical protein
MKSIGWQPGSQLAGSREVRGLVAVVEPDWIVCQPANVHHELASQRCVIAEVLINRGGDRVSDRRSWPIVERGGIPPARFAWACCVDGVVVFYCWPNVCLAEDRVTEDRVTEDRVTEDRVVSD